MHMMNVFRGWAAALCHSPGEELGALELEATTSEGDFKLLAASGSQPGSDIRTSLASFLSDDLGVTDADVGNPHIELTDLLLNGARDASALTNLCTATVFANLLVILPSTFHGGTLRVTHGDRSESYDYCLHADANLIVLAWQAGALPEFAPLTDGYHLTLCYRVIHSTDLLVTVISLQDKVVSRLRDILSRWDALKGEGKPVPHKLVHLLHNKYSRDIGLPHDILKDADSRAVSLLGNIGKLHGFTVGLADMRGVVYGFANAELSNHNLNNYGSDTEYEAEMNWQDPRTKSDRTEIAIRRLVHLDGNVIRPTLDYDVDMEPTYSEAKLIEVVVAGKHDKQYHDLTRNGGLKFRRGMDMSMFNSFAILTTFEVYYRTVAVIWPIWAHFAVAYGPNGIPAACERLRACVACQPTPEDIQFVEDILANARAPHLEAAVSSVCSVATIWNDPALWLHAVKACNAEGSISTICTENVQKAAWAIGIQKVQLW
ncbi:hypothetical protein C8Q80DRAFT_1348569 [Daedaleopsis nitida]|nr:hypothetical protein C8Q80DRAFT_1348569 [Daedaleopsis nitida]